MPTCLALNRQWNLAMAAGDTAAADAKRDEMLAAGCDEPWVEEAYEGQFMNQHRPPPTPSPSPTPTPTPG